MTPRNREKWIRTTDNLYLRYQVIGTGYPLVLLHGNGGDLHYFDAHISKLAQDFQLILVDQRDHGKSDLARNAYSFEHHCADISAILDAEKITAAHFLGFSDGAILALLYAQKYPQRVTKLVANAPNIELTGLKQPQQELFKVAATLVSPLRALPYFNKWHRWLRLIVEPLPLNWSDLATITQPTLLLVGQHDLVKEEHSQKIAATLPHATLTIIPKGSHRVAQEQPELFAQLVLAFLRSESSVYPIKTSGLATAQNGLAAADF